MLSIKEMAFQHHMTTYIIKPITSFYDAIFISMPLLQYFQILVTKVYIKSCICLYLGMELLMPAVSTLRRLKQDYHKFEVNMDYLGNWQLSSAT